MIGFGYVQEDTKIKLNHYMAVGDRYADFYDYGHEECEWDRTCMIEKRKSWWDGYAPLCRTNVAYTRDTYEVFHGWGRAEMVREYTLYQQKFLVKRRLAGATLADCNLNVFSILRNFRGVPVRIL